MTTRLKVIAGLAFALAIGALVWKADQLEEQTRRLEERANAASSAASDLATEWTRIRRGLSR